MIPEDDRRGSREAAPKDGNLIRTLPTADLTAPEMLAIRELLESSFASEDETFTAADWEHTLHGVHAVAEIDGQIVAHAAVVRRLLEADGRPLSTGYVEGVATYA